MQLNGIFIYFLLPWTPEPAFFLFGRGWVQEGEGTITTDGVQIWAALELVVAGR